MSARLPTVALALLAALAMTGCGEKPQAASGPVKKADAKAWDGPADGAPHGAEGFKAGDKTAWEAQLKARTERGQNEYTRTSSTKK